MKNEVSSNNQRLSYSPSEFARLNGKHPSWTYRLLYDGRLRAITSLGRILVPAEEWERLVATATTYDPKPKKRKTEKVDGEEENHRDALRGRMQGKGVPQ